MTSKRDVLFLILHRIIPKLGALFAEIQFGLVLARGGEEGGRLLEDFSDALRHCIREVYAQPALPGQMDELLFRQ